MLAAGQFCPASKVENTHLKDYRTATKTNTLTAVSDVTAGQTAQNLVSKLGSWLIFMSDRGKKTRLIRLIF